MTDVPVTLMRGGTSKGVFLALDLLPPPGDERDRFVLALMGSPDPMQLDGLGGTHSSTSKVVAVTGGADGEPLPPDVDVAYLFAQVGVAKAVVDTRGNCGNLTAAVAPYAMFAGLVPGTDPTTVVRLLNLNTGQRIKATVPTENGLPREHGDFRLGGVPGTAARTDIEFVAPLGAVDGRVLPTGKPVDEVRTSHGDVRTSVVDVTAPVVCVAAADIGLRGDETQAQLNAMPEVLAVLREIRADAAVRCGLASTPEHADTETPAVPRVALLAPGGADADLTARMTSMGVVHHALPGTGTLAIAAAARLPGTVAHDMAATTSQSDTTVRVAHPKGVATTTVTSEDGVPTAVGLPRTARRLLTGVAHVPG